MKESLRRVVLFTVIVITGSVMILFDVPLVFMIPLILTVGVIILVLLGAITRADISSVFSKKSKEKPKKISFIKRLNEMKFFEKKSEQPDKKPESSRKKEENLINAAKKTGAGSPLRSFLSSLSSLGSVLKERSRQTRKVEHINELLDKAVSEKVKGSALAGAGGDASSGSGPGSSGGRGSLEQAKDTDPFMSLSGDEFDVSLLDGLDDTEPSPPQSSPGQDSSPVKADMPDLPVQEPDIPVTPSRDIGTEADDILKDNAGGLEEFSGLEGGESIDQDFGDLDNLDLDKLDLDAGGEEETGKSAGDVSPQPTESPASKNDGATTPVKTAWIPSDAPRDAGITEEQVSTQADMSSFSKGASGSDEDMLSSLASDVKHVTKERNLSLIRDLKDFEAPATEIEKELKETFERLKTSPNRKETGTAAKGMK